MAPTVRLIRLLLISFTALLVTAQDSTPSTTATPPTGDSATSSAAATPTTTDRPLQLWSIANGLLTSYYPSTTLDGVSTLSWPDTVVIGGTTYNVQSLSDATATPTSISTHQAVVSTTATPTSPATTEGDKNPNKDRFLSDKKLAIIIGSVIGVVVLILLAVVFWCLKRRKDDTGSFFMRRRSPSIASSHIRSWLPSGRSDTFGNTAYVSAGASNPDAWEKEAQVAVRPQMGEPRISQHPAFAPARLHGSSRSTSDENPFYTPAERMDAQLGHNVDVERGAYDPHPVELDDNGQSVRRSSESLRASGDRPPTPFSPMEMMGFGASRAGPLPQVSRHDFGENSAQQQSGHATNPFSSPEDEEQDLVSPILPSRSPERRHSPMVHYPSWSEVSEFDFHGDGRRGLRNVSSSETDGGDGWRPVRDRPDGRYELA